MARTTKAHISFWGTRGSIPTPGRITEKYGGNTACVSIFHKDTYVIMDSGSGIRSYGLELLNNGLGTEKKPLSIHLFLSHTHWDHIQGLPFFNPLYLKRNKLYIYGTPKKKGVLGSILSDQMTLQYFPVTMANLSAEIHVRELTNEAVQLGDMSIDWQEQHFHPGGSVRYRITVNGKRIVYASDVELNQVFAPKKKTEESEFLVQEYLDFIKDANLLIADAQYTDDEYPHRLGWGHTSVPVLLDAAYSSGVKQVACFHHDPQHSDKFLDDLWSKYSPKYHTKSPPMHIFWAREGLTMPI